MKKDTRRYSANHLTTHTQALNHRVPLERVLIECLTKLGFFGGEGRDDPVDFCLTQGVSARLPLGEPNGATARKTEEITKKSAILSDLVCRISFVAYA